MYTRLKFTSEFSYRECVCRLVIIIIKEKQGARNDIKSNLKRGQAATQNKWHRLKYSTLKLTLICNVSRRKGNRQTSTLKISRQTCSPQKRAVFAFSSPENLMIYQNNSSSSKPFFSLLSLFSESLVKKQILLTGFELSGQFLFEIIL